MTSFGGGYKGRLEDERMLNVEVLPKWKARSVNVQRC